MPEFQPTPEQQEAIRLFGTGQSLAIEAGAGTGKTATLMLLAASTKKRGQYVAFNKAIVVESAAKFPPHVACSTAHSLAYKATVGQNNWMGNRLRSSRRMKSSEIADRLEVDPLTLRLPGGETKRLARGYLAGLAMRGVTRFCQSADPEPHFRHVPYIDGIDLPPGNRANNDTVAKHLVRAMNTAWADLNNGKGELPFKHDHYLKMWQLDKPRINADFILFDEAQDANPVLVDIVKQQTHAQLVWVGDSQQQIYTFTGAINALAQVGAEQRTFLTKSFRFGPEIADIANDVLDLLPHAELRLTGYEAIESKVEELHEGEHPDVILCRTNARAVRHFLDALRSGRKPHIVGGGREILEFAKGAKALAESGFTAHPELACFESWSEVQEYVEMDEQGSDLRLLVKLIDEFTTDRIIQALAGMPREEHADVIISTAHKSKGREWATVQLADDFPANPRDEELRLLYVAVTRAKHRLDVSAIKLEAWSTEPSMEMHLVTGGEPPSERYILDDVARQLLDPPPGGMSLRPRPGETAEDVTEAAAPGGQDGDQQADDLINRLDTLTIEQLRDLELSIHEEMRRRVDDHTIHGDRNGDWTCSCGRKIHGNAAAASHMKAHQRRGVNATWIREEQQS